ncbi:MAG: dTDP-glucose 4,6-dehydratase [Gammaproteobacteria bacterium RBG_16_57_12]|nr:MAG: dTDP-glucose 4,6-dehydratase [Gammaproteobacteria bacterium RBG_16_57_12]
MPRLLVTGGAGFIGSNFVHYWLRRHPDDRLVVLDALTYAGNLANLEPVKHNPQYRFVHGNICDQALVEKLLVEEQLDTLVHFAAESHVDRSITGPDAFIETNIVGTHSLLKAAKNIWLDTRRQEHRFHHVSTDEVYGSLGPHDPAFTEETPYAPNSPYAASKAASDHLVRAYHHTYGLQVTTSNCSNNYGPYHFPEKLIPLVITNILQGKPIPIYGDGLNIRDWLYVEDHCRGIELVLQQGRVGETYNIGGNNEWTNIDIVKLICDIMDELRPRSTRSAELITFIKDRPGHDRRYAIDAEKTMTELGYQPLGSFETGIRKTITWYLENEAWWKSIMEGSYLEWIEKQYSISDPTAK